MWQSYLSRQADTKVRSHSDDKLSDGGEGGGELIRKRILETLAKAI
jgi:hypothetical protein